MEKEERLNGGDRTKYAELYLSESQMYKREPRACNLAEYGFMFSIDTQLSACNVMKNIMYTTMRGVREGEGRGKYSALNL